MHLSPTRNNLLAHILNYSRQLIGSYVRVCVNEDIFFRTVLVENIQNSIHIAAFLAPGVKFSVGICTGTAFSEAIITIFIHHSLAGYLCQVGSAVFYVLAAFQHHRLYTEFYKPQCGKQPTRTRSNHNGSSASIHRAVVYFVAKRNVMRHLVDIYS